MHLLNGIHQMEDEMISSKTIENNNINSSLFEDRMRVLDQSVTILNHRKGSIYIIGTLHDRVECADAVKQLIKMIKPHIVAVELCLSGLERFNIGPYVGTTAAALGVRNEERITIDLDFIPRRLREKAIGEKLLLSLIWESMKYEKLCIHQHPLKRFAMINPYARRFAVKPKVFDEVIIGREMTTPFADKAWQLTGENSQYLSCSSSAYKIMLADKPIEQTFCDISAALSDNEKKIIRIYKDNFIRLFIALSHKSKSLLLAMMDKNKKLGAAIVANRDEYMARSLCKALRGANKAGSAKVIAVVGRNHLNGITERAKRIMYEYDEKRKKKKKSQSSKSARK